MENSYTKWLELQEELELIEQRQLPILTLSKRLFHAVREWNNLIQNHQPTELFPLADLIMDLCRGIIQHDVIHFNNYFYYNLPRIFRFTLAMEYDYFIYRD